VTPAGLEPAVIALKGRGFGRLIYGAFFSFLDGGTDKFTCFVFLLSDLVIIIRILLISPGDKPNRCNRYSNTFLLILSAKEFDLRMYIYLVGYQRLELCNRSL
jgi:hypothetical protein